jgi:hypothetical protein
MSVGQQDRKLIRRKAAEAAGKARSLLEDMRCSAGAATSVPPSEELPSWLASIEAPVEFAVLPARMETVLALWRPVFLPLSILQAEGTLAVGRGMGRQPWDVSLSLIDKIKSKTGGGALAAAKRQLMETAGRAAWWLPARLELMAAGEAATEAMKQRWNRSKLAPADLSKQDLAFAGLAVDPDAPAAFDLGNAARLTDRQGSEGNWSLDGFAGAVISTAFALEALRRWGVDDREAAVLRGGEWLRSVQNADGGWGGDGEAHSTVVRTACAVTGLVAGGDAGSESVRRGIDYLVGTQDAGGGWKDDGWNWQLLPGLVECRSSLDALTLPLMALSAFVSRSEAGRGAGWPGVQR